MKHSFHIKTTHTHIINMPKIAALSAMLAASLSCTALYADNTADANDADAYTSAEDEAKAAAEAGEADAYEADTADKKSKQTKAKKGNPRKQGIFKFIYGNGRYIEYDESKLFTSNPIGKLILMKGTFIVNPKNGDAGIKTRYQASNYAVLFDEQMRHRIFAAVDQYLDDFANKKLKRKDKKSYVAYGRGKAYINYGTLAVMMAAEGKPDIQIGYKFKEKSPYFTITVRSAPNIDPNKGYNDVKDSAEFILYFTKAQAQAMCNMLRDEVVQEALLSENEEIIDSGKAAQGDEYEEE